MPVPPFDHLASRVDASDASRHERFGRMIATIYPQLRRIAATKTPSMGGSPSSLAQETICRLISLPVPPKDEQAALAIGCRLMEWLRIDRFRSSTSRRLRELDVSIRGDSREVAGSDQNAQSRQLSQVLAQLAEAHPRMAEALMLSAVCRLSHEQIAAALEVSVRTIRRDLDFAKAWVASRLTAPSPVSAPDA
jgi:DNA-directed RNA polymerase specialized sigma24 family protein